MTGRRIYAAASGECLVRDSADVDEAERSRIEHDFYAGVRLVVDPDHDEVRGFVPAKRRSDEAFFAIVDVGDTAAPLETFRTVVEAEFSERPGWSIRDDTPEGQLFQGLGRRDTNLPPDVATATERLPSEGPIRIGIADLEIATGLLSAVCDGDVTVVVGQNDAEHVEYDVLCVERDQERPAVLNPPAESESGEETRGLLDRIPFVRNRR